MQWLIAGVIIFAAGVLLGAYIVDRIRHDKPVISKKQQKHKAKPGIRDEELGE